MGTSRLLATGAAAVMALGMAAGASADHRDGYRGRAVPRGDRGYGYGAYEIAFEKGYEEGLEDGRKDRDRRRRFDPARHDEYRDGDHGYRERYGSRHRYVHGFRSGYERGYRDGYDVRGYGRARRGGYDRSRYRY
jgi:hypothetical protein